MKATGFLAVYIFNGIKWSEIAKRYFFVFIFADELLHI